MAQQQQRYKVLEKIASGGMAEVFRAESAGLEGFKKIVAIKRVLPHLSEKKQFMGMFLDEARVSAQLSHSNCVQVFDIGVGDNTYFIVMEFVDGADLKSVIEHRKRVGNSIPLEEACLICVRICEGLAYAHGRTDSKGQCLGIVHRDMSPPNVLITRWGEVKIVDFGLAKANSQLEKSEPGIIKGKFSYLSPEAADGKPIDGRTDLFAVGIILWELLANRRLFLGETDIETVRLVQAATVPDIRQFNPAVPRELCNVLAKALAQSPDNRYQTAREFGQALNDILFRLRRSVSSFDIAQLVLPVVAERQERKKQKGKDRRSIIGALIDEVLFEFRSIQPDEVGSRPAGSAPLQLDSFHDWGNEFSSHGRPVAATAGEPPRNDAEFNLAALEDDTGTGREGRSSVGSHPGSGQAPLQREDRAVPAQRPSEAPQDLGPRRNNTGLVVLLLFLLVAAAGSAGAYFGGLF